MTLDHLTDEQLLNHEEFFSKVEDLNLSASALKLLIENPKTYYKHYVLNEREVKKGKHFDEGSLIHCMVLEPEELQNRFVNMGVPTPSDNTKGCIDYLLSLERNASELEEYAQEIVDYLKEINLHQSLVDDKKPDKNGVMLTGDQKRVAKIVNENTIEYFRIMVEAREKTIVDAASWDKCYAKAQAILTNEKALFLLKPVNDTDEVRYELELSDRPDELQFGVKGILDVIKVDRVNKTIYVSDIKSHGGKLKDFKDSAEKYDYWLQPVIYKLLAQSLLRKQAFDFKIEFNFIVVDQNDNVYCFPVGEETYEKWMKQLVYMINTEANYHLTTQDFTLPYQFANNLVSL
jgi:hypothetical protein